MNKHIQFLFLALVIVLNTKASPINKPVVVQYGFIQNKGQIIDQNNQPNSGVLYLYNGNGLRVQLRKGGFSYEVMNTVKTHKAIINTQPASKLASETDSFDISYEVHRVDINFKDGNKNASVKPYEAASDYINYYTTATGEEGITHVQHFQKVIYENVYPNIDIEFVLNDATNKGKFKYNFIVKPYANLANIQLDFVGANHTRLNKEGNIIIETAHGNIEENIPLSYVINKDNSHSTIKATFVVLTHNVFGINAEDYNHTQTLVIDPTNWATYYGGYSYDSGYGIATDANGNSIITGSTSSGAMATVGAHQTTYGGSPYNDAFIVKFNSNGVRQWATYYGGSSIDNGDGITTDTGGNIIIIGSTTSLNAIATVGAHQTTYGGGGTYDAFIAKFNTNGVRQWATYYGGSNMDYGKGIATDANGNIIITGNTASTNAIATIGAYQTIFSGGIDGDAYIAKFNSNGVIQWATYYGGSTNDYGNEIATDANGNIMITGWTNSSNAIATVGAYQAIFGGGSYDAYIAKFNSNGVIQWATYYGGSTNDYGNGIAKDANGNIIITGYTNSTNAIATVGTHQIIFGGGSYDAFIAKFNNNGVIQWATYYGGSGYDEGRGIATDAGANILITGFTNSSNAIATIGAHKTIFGGGSYDAFIAKFNTNGIRQWASYYGGTDSDYGDGIATDANGNIIITGSTSSPNAIATTGAQQTVISGFVDAFIAKFSPTGILPVKLITFNAALVNKKVNCTWETASEINNDYFTIERSIDGNNFESVGTVKGQGFSNTNTRYSFTDNNPFNSISYYRLKQTDFDDRYTYSPIKRVGSQEKLASAISLYYENNNPTVKINAWVASKAIIELMNLNGITIFTYEQAIIVGDNTVTINKNITQGVYLLKVQLEEEVAFFKVWIW
ncbi:MAG: SBBP repeat-containing protein [Bacteroidota bacterium]